MRTVSFFKSYKKTQQFSGQTGQSDFAGLVPSSSEKPGRVSLVGAGPGDPELLTLKALRAIHEADIVFYDALVGDGIMSLIPEDVETVNVGKRKAKHTVPQADIISRLAMAALAGKRVVRLKGGDPFIFGRGGEELEGLVQQNIPVDVVPGISSALGCAANAGIPLTHRDLAQSVTFLTGHARDDSQPDWSLYASGRQTLVVFMGVGTAAITAEGLIRAGRAATTPVAVVENGTLETERVIHSSLESLESDISRSSISGPALLIIGEVAAARQMLPVLLENVA